MDLLLRSDCGYSEVFSNILSRLRAYDLFQLSRTSVALRKTVYGTSWNPQVSFARHFTDFKALLTTLKEHNAIISGSAALGFFEGSGSRDCGDVDIYINGSENGQSKENVKAVGLHLIRTQGYGFISTELSSAGSSVQASEDMFCREVEKQDDDQPETNPYDNDSILRVFDLARPGTTAKVQLVVVSTPDPTDAVLAFYLMAVVNFITASHAVSVFDLQGEAALPHKYT